MPRLKRITLVVCCLLLLPVCAAAQKSVSDLPRAQAAAVRDFLRRRPKLRFLSENRIDAEYLKSMREYLGADLRPYYEQADFNGDGRQDFAIILVKDEPPEVQPDLAETHRDYYKLSVVIFNGRRGGRYSAAFIEETTAPLVCLINVTKGRRKQLYFGVFETDAHGFTVVPTRKGYRVFYQDMD